MKLSIVIPVYNTEKYVESCILSCEKQTCKDIESELIVVNDGTIDNSVAVVEKLQKQFHNIILIHQENQGLSGARNTGISHATGDYIWFVDSDDTINSNSFEYILSQSKVCPDIIALNYTTQYVDGTIKRSIHSNVASTGIEALKKGIRIQACFNIFRRSLFQNYNLSFYPHIYHEDLEFSPRAFYFAKRIAYIEEPIYYVLKRPGSITTTVNPKRAYDYLTVAKNLIQFRKEKEISFPEFNHYICRAVNNSFRVISQVSYEISNFMKEYNASIKKDIPSCYLSSKRLQFNLIGAFLKLFPQAHYSVFKILLRL